MRSPLQPKEEALAAGGQVRPFPPADLDRFTPAPDLRDWALDSFASYHEHLEEAQLGFLWAPKPWKRRNRMTLAVAEIPKAPATLYGWRKLRYEQQVADWFGEDLDFLLTFWAQGWEELDDRSACALMEHELYHCEQAQDKYGDAKFDKDGRPRWTLVGHPVEEFPAVVARYGAWSEDLRDMAAALRSAPVATNTWIAGVCGTCRAA